MDTKGKKLGISISRLVKVTGNFYNYININYINIK